MLLKTLVMGGPLIHCFWTLCSNFYVKWGGGRLIRTLRYDQDAWAMVTRSRSLEHWNLRLYQVKTLFSRPKFQEMAHPAPTKGYSLLSPDTAMLFAPFRCTHPPPLVPPFLLTQSLSPKDIAGCDIMKLKVS